MLESHVKDTTLKDKKKSQKFQNRFPNQIKFLMTTFKANFDTYFHIDNLAKN